MEASRDLEQLLRDMTPVVAAPAYVFCSFADRRLPAGVDAVCLFNEAEGLTAILDQSDADRLGIAYDFTARMITLTVHSDLAAVGFLAVISTKLAQARIACNVVSAFYHDHLFVPAERADEAMNILRALSAPSDAAEA
ncbi:ACT domain-containing protein [Paraburkholderia bryophila]|uniref:ACT domain-containing protein n=1 Tax=Burkholderiaceae TaxID=119060 RepID=UPI00054D34F0|nr:ACT domain-containing protein [Burkholderia sp. 9120]